MGLDPQVRFTKRDEGRDMEDGARREVVELEAVVDEEAAEEGVRRQRQAALVEGSEGDDLTGPQRGAEAVNRDPASGGLRRRHEPLLQQGGDARVGDGGLVPLRHGFLKLRQRQIYGEQEQVPSFLSFLSLCFFAFCFSSAKEARAQERLSSGSTERTRGRARQ